MRLRPITTRRNASLDRIGDGRWWRLPLSATGDKGFLLAGVAVSVEEDGLAGPRVVCWAAWTSSPVSSIDDGDVGGEVSPSGTGVQVIEGARRGR